MNNPAKRYLLKTNQEARYRDKTLMFADNHYGKWGEDELEYLRQYGQIKTAQTIALDLGRTYKAIIVKVSKEKIPLLTEKKIH